MSDKAERRAARAVVGDYHQAQLGEIVGHVAEAIDRFRAGELDAFDVDEVLLQYSRVLPGRESALEVLQHRTGRDHGEVHPG